MNDEQLVAEFLQGKGLTPVRFTKEERKVETPDFRLLLNGNVVGYCEVKSRLDIPFEGVKKDTSMAALAADIHTQLDSVNPERQAYNILALVNHEMGLDCTFLHSVLTGNFFADSGKIYPIYRKISEGRIRLEKRRIDLYLWFDPPKRTPFMLFTPPEADRFPGLCRILGIDPDSVPEVPS